MADRMAVPVIAGNWKMHKTPSETRAFFERFREIHAPREDRSMIFFPPALSFAAAREARGDRTDLRLGVQDIHWKAEGAFTGAVSAPMAVDAGADFTLVGHSERRHVFGETDDETGKKVRAAFDAGFVPVLCVGEKLDERKAGRVDEVVLRQLDEGTRDLDAGMLARMLIAYEPVWAIGTGETATPEDAADAHGTIRERLGERLDDPGDVPILYGGSVKPHNAAELLAADDVDGVLVGGASLDPEAFARIAAA